MCYPTIKVTNTRAKIEFAEKRLKLFNEWAAPANLKQTKKRCMAALCEQICFLQNARERYVLKLKKRGD